MTLSNAKTSKLFACATGCLANRKCNWMAEFSAKLQLSIFPAVWCQIRRLTVQIIICCFLSSVFALHHFTGGILKVA